MIAASVPGAYASESAYQMEGDAWKQRYWGENYGRLIEIKRKWDPNGTFWCRHCVGSDDEDFVRLLRSRAEIEADRSENAAYASVQQQQVGHARKAAPPERVAHTRWHPNAH